MPDSGWQTVSCPLCGGNDQTPERKIRAFALVRCRACGMVFANPQPTDAALAAAYNGEGELARAVGGHLDKIEFYRTWFSDRDRRTWAHHLRHLADLIGRPGRLLEYGCGPAMVGQVAAAAGWRVDAIDVGAWIRRLQAERGFPLHVGTIRDQGWPDGTFDAVYAQDVLEHLSRPREELAEIARVLRPGGALYVHVPNYASLTIRCGVSRFAYNEPPGHLNYFTPKTLTAMLRQNGFDRIRLGSDHLEYADFGCREPVDYDAFERRIAAQGRREGGRLWSALRAAMNVPLRRFLLGTYLWGYAVRQ